MLAGHHLEDDLSSIFLQGGLLHCLGVFAWLCDDQPQQPRTRLANHGAVDVVVILLEEADASLHPVGPGLEAHPRDVVKVALALADTEEGAGGVLPDDLWAGVEAQESPARREGVRALRGHSPEVPLWVQGIAVEVVTEFVRRGCGGRANRQGQGVHALHAACERGGDGPESVLCRPQGAPLVGLALPSHRHKVRLAAHVGAPSSWLALFRSHPEEDHVPSAIRHLEEVCVAGAVNPIVIREVARGEDWVPLVGVVRPCDLVAHGDGHGVVDARPALGNHEVVLTLVLVQVRALREHGTVQGPSPQEVALPSQLPTGEVDLLAPDLALPGKVWFGRPVCANVPDLAIVEEDVGVNARGPLQHVWL
mmetsp:Transcript_47940/g.148119  ORF Transcript_47940/g.148119 Transcript_47940/m.148119 type:complete len:365 (+) Transcript_47940:482-1576(+)